MGAGLPDDAEIEAQQPRLHESCYLAGGVEQVGIGVEHIPDLRMGERIAVGRAVVDRHPECDLGLATG